MDFQDRETANHSMHVSTHVRLQSPLNRATRHQCVHSTCLVHQQRANREKGEAEKRFSDKTGAPVAARHGGHGVLRGAPRRRTPAGRPPPSAQQRVPPAASPPR
jgi:hypothetical protein